MDNSETIEFERLNYFKGMFTTAADWEDEQNYHREKLQFVNRVLRNKPGIVSGMDHELAVEPCDDSPDGGGKSVRVQPGAAVDPIGNLLYLAQNATVKLPTITNGEGDTTVYVTIKYNDIPRRYVMNHSHPEYSDFTRKLENPLLEASKDPVGEDEKERVELARIRLTQGADKISRASNPYAPGINEIDRSKVKWSPTVAQHVARLDDHDRKLAEEERKTADFEERLARLDDHSRRRSRSLHTPGIFQSELEDFLVQPAGGLNVSVHAGAALDSLGHTIVFESSINLPVGPVGSEPELVYIVIRHKDGRPSITRTKPDNHTALELARIDLHPGAKEIKNPVDVDNPGPNEIDLCGKRWAGAVGVVEAFMSPQTLQRVIQAMEPTRRNFAALDDRFPTPFAGDVRHSALTVTTLARIGCIPPGRLRGLMATLAGIEQDVGNDIFKKYDAIVNTSEEFHLYRSSVADLLAALRQGTEDDILIAQTAVANAAQVLAMTAIENPIADAGSDQEISTIEDEVTLRLDASSSRGRGGRDIVEYAWDRAA